MVNGTKYTIYFDHKPNDREVLASLSEKLKNADYGQNKGSFGVYCDKYIDSRRGILSPSTLGGYQKCKRLLSDEFKQIKLSDITQSDVQLEIKRYSIGHSPKSVRNLHGFISAVLGEYRPSLKLYTSLPQAKAPETILPITEEVEKIIKASEGTPYHIGFQLAVLGLRRSEICSVTIDDLKGNILKINKARIYDEDNHLIIRNNTKTTESTREIYLPDSLVEEIKEAGVIYDRTPSMLVKTLHKYQDMLGIERFRLHDFRHYYASYAHSMGIPDVYIMKAGGWKTDYVMKRVYRDALRDKNHEMQLKAIEGIFGGDKKGDKI